MNTTTSIGTTPRPAESRPPCFGNLFPDFLAVDYNRPAKGEAFDVLIESEGAGVQRKMVSFKSEAWARCAASPEFDECYRLSIARLLLAIKLDRYS